MPHRMERAQAIVAGLVGLGLAAAWVFTHPTLSIHQGFCVHWLFWSTVAIAVTISFFWPFGETPRLTLRPVLLRLLPGHNPMDARRPPTGG